MPGPSPIPDIGPPHVVPDVVGPNDNTDPDAKDDTVAATIAVFLIFLAVGFIAAARKNGRGGFSL